MKIIGLDFSNRYPGICISDNFNTFDFISVVNSKDLSNVNKNFLIDTETKCDDFFISFTDPSSLKSSELYYENERLKLLNYTALANKIISEIKKVVNGHDVIISMEGISYNSKNSRSLIDLAFSTGIVRKEINDLLLKGNISRFFVFTPGELKNSIDCKGNAGKLDVFDKFLDDPIIDSVKDSDIYKFIKDNRDHDYVVKNNNIKHPWDDLIDAYLCVLKIYRSFK